MGARDPGNARGEVDSRNAARLAETVETVLWLVDCRAERLTYLNPAFETLTGRSRESIYEKPSSWTEFVDPADRTPIAEAYARGEPFERIVCIFRADGEPRWVSLHATPIRDAQGTLTHFAGTAEDFTERRNRGLAEREVGNAFRSLAENVLDLISRHDLEGKLLYVSPSLRDVLGWDPEKLTQRPALEWLEPTQVEKLVGVGRRLLDGSESETFELRVRHRDGSDRWLQSRCRLLHDELDRPTEVLTVSRDVTEERRAAAALAESEERFRQLAEHIHQVFWLVDWEARRVEYVSPAYEKIWGRKIEAIRDQSHRWSEAIHPDDRERVGRAFVRTAAIGEFDVEYRVVRPDGEIRWIHDRGFPIRDAKGRVYRIAGIAEDVTEARQASVALQESEARFRQLAEHLNGMFWLTDWRTGRMIYRTRTIAGLIASKQDDPYDWRDLIHPDDREDAVRAVQRLPETGSFETQYRAISSTGEIHWLRSQGFAIRDEKGKVVRAAGLVEDVTERRRLEARVQQTQKLESLGVLAGGIAHDFNNLLTGILGNASLALGELPEGTPARGMIEEIEQAARRAAGLCSQMLAYSGRTSLEKQPLDLSEVVRGIVPLLRASLRSATVSTSLSRELPAIRGDANQLGQIVINLLTNAAESLPDEGGTVRISTRLSRVDGAALRASYLKQELPAGEYVCLEVSDSGCGMDAETRGKMFEPFFTTKFTGRGLGLAAVLGIVRSHGGAVFVESDPGAGTTFRLMLPLAQGETVAPAPVAATKPRRGREATVLVIDDEEVVRLLAARVLERVGYTVRCAAGGEAGLTLHHEQRGGIDAVLLDLTMPDCSGKEVLARLRQRSRELPVVLMSGYAESEIDERVRSLGVSGFVHKPFDGATLIRTVDEALGARAGVTPA